MSTPARQVVGEALEYLQALQREGLRPDDGQARLVSFKQRHPGMAMDLLHEEESYDGSVHYDLLLHLPEGGTVSLSYCPDRALPWPLRGVLRWSDRDFLRVNERVLQVDEVIAFLDFIWEQSPILDRLVNACLIHQALARDPIELSDDELQDTLDAFRRRHRLYKAADMHRWLEQRGVTHERLERLLAHEVRCAKLRDRVAADRVESYFADHPGDFDTAGIARLDFAQATDAEQLATQVRAGGQSFHEAAEQRFLATGRPGESARPFFVVMQRRQAPASLAPVFAARPGEVVGPLPVEGGYSLVRVLSVTTGRLDKATRIAITTILFEEWLQERRQAARIEWFWGKATTSSPSD